MSHIPALRTRVLSARSQNPTGEFVLYWMVASRRLEWNYALDRAIEIARETGRPLVVLEALRAGYRWASDRHHAFVLQGMAEHRRRLDGSAVAYYPHVELAPGEGAGLLEALAERAVAVVSDWSPTFFLPRMIEVAAGRVPVRFEAVDSCGLLPLGAVEKAYSSAYHFRRFLQNELPAHLTDPPDPEPLAQELPGGAAVPEEVLRRWPRAEGALLDLPPGALDALPIDHSVRPIEERGGRSAARIALDSFLATGLPRYAEARNHPDADATSRLSPWLHWGHLSPHEVFTEVAAVEGWTPMRLSERADGRRAGWWGMSPGAEAFLDQLVTWRELGYGFCEVVSDYHTFDSLPDWAIETLEEHAADEREHIYSLDEFDRAETHDPVWNAAQRQLRVEGVIHSYLRMLWGKKILEWTAHPREALDVMVELNNRYAVDGRDPNSWSGIFWILGRFDRGWPERDIYGKVRSMSSDRTRKKVDLDGYLARFDGD